MKTTLLAVLSFVLLLSGLAITAAAQENSEGTINTLSVNPRQNAELGNYTGTESGQPSESVPGSESQPNGLVPSNTRMTGSGNNGNTQGIPPVGQNGSPQARSEANPNNNAAQAKKPGAAKPKSTANGNANSNAKKP